MKQKLVIKIGTSILSNGDVIEIKSIEKICRFVAELKSKFDIILVSSGAVASGYTRINLDKSELSNKRSLASIGQPLLMNAYNQCLSKYNIIPSQLLFISTIFDSKDKIQYTKETINTLLKNNILPILNENDAIAQNDLTFGDNDQLSAYVAHYFDSNMLVILSDVYGYYDKDPLKNKDAKLIKYINKINKDRILSDRIAGSKFATGGIVTKLMAANFLLNNNKEMFLCSGFDLKPTLDFLLKGNHYLGTLFSTKQGIEV